MKKAIIHISDLHITSHLDTDGYPNKEINSFFNTDSSSDEPKSYLDRVVMSIKESYSDYEFYLVITGDITEKANTDEFIKAFEFLEYFLKELNIPKAKTLIVPGDHDVNWTDCKVDYDKKRNANQNLTAPECYKAKLSKYKEFIDKFYGDNTFKADNAVSRYICFENQLILLGLNSNFKVGTKPALGYIPKDILKTELEKLNFNKPIIGVFHHNFNAEYENKAHGQWDKTNLIQIKQYLQSIDTRAVFYGNEHTPASSKEKEFFFSACGSLGDKESRARSFKIYKLNQQNNGIKLDIELFTNTNHGNQNDGNIGYFTSESKPKNELPAIIIKEQETQKKTKAESNEIPSTNIYKSALATIKSDYSKDLFNLVRDKKLFHFGHFHWSETSRAHNWIDVTKILNNHNDVILAKDSILSLINSKVGESNYNFIIGLGIEGNILSTKVSIKHNKPYSFLPYSYRYEDHNKFEKELCFENNGEYDSVLIITDVVNDGRTIRKLIHKAGRADVFFKKVKKIFVVSLFYTGKETNPSSDILNLKEDIRGDHKESRIEYYFVTAMKVEECPYKEDYRTACIIMQNPELGCIHKFYDEK